jgi:hypothetical protein
MPQARSGGARSTSRSRSTSGAKSTSGRSQTKRSTSSGPASRSKSTRAGGSGAGGSRTSGSGSSGSTTASRASSARSSTAAAADARFDAVAQRLRKLNERIIEAGREAGETTLSSYEKALKAIASTIEKGPGSSEIDWISNVATAQAKFIRDVTTAWTTAARDRLK